MSSDDSYLSLLDIVIRSAEGCVSVNFVVLWHRRIVSDLYLLNKIYHRADHPLHEYLHHFVAARNTRGSVVLCELAW